MKNLINKTALVTGASSGIGEAFAYELAQQGANLIITARSAQKLEAIAEDIKKKYDVRVYVFVENLAIRGSAEQLFNVIKKQNLEIDLLVNNAGFGKWTNFLDETI